MEQIMGILNSPFVLLISGAAISGLLVQWIAARWQHRNWVSQQKFTAQMATFEKEVSQKHQVLEDINQAVAVILSHCQRIAVGHEKGVSSQQKSDQIKSYNEAVMHWEIDFWIFVIRLKAMFEDAEVEVLWNRIKKDRDDLDVKLYLLASKHQGSSKDCYLQVEKISNLTVELSKRMLAEIDRMKERPF